MAGGVLRIHCNTLIIDGGKIDMTGKGYTGGQSDRYKGYSHKNTNTGVGSASDYCGGGYGTRGYNATYYYSSRNKKGGGVYGDKKLLIPIKQRKQVNYNNYNSSKVNNAKSKSKTKSKSKSNSKTKSRAKSTNRTLNTNLRSESHSKKNNTKNKSKSKNKTSNDSKQKNIGSVKTNGGKNTETSTIATTGKKKAMKKPKAKKIGKIKKKNVQISKKAQHNLYLGSGGGGGLGSVLGTSGGGAIAIECIDKLILYPKSGILANGVNRGWSNERPGCGSGGSIYIKTPIIQFINIQEILRRIKDIDNDNYEFEYKYENIDKNDHSLYYRCQRFKEYLPIIYKVGKWIVNEQDIPEDIKSDVIYVQKILRRREERRLNEMLPKISAIGGTY